MSCVSVDENWNGSTKEDLLEENKKGKKKSPGMESAWFVGPIGIVI